MMIVGMLAMPLGIVQRQLLLENVYGMDHFCVQHNTALKEWVAAATWEKKLPEANKSEANQSGWTPRGQKTLLCRHTP